MTSKLKCPKCGEQMDETVLLSFPAKYQYRCGKCGHTEIKSDTTLYAGNTNPLIKWNRNLIDEIMALIPDGRRYDYMERLESKDGEIIVRIHTKRDNDE